MASCSFFLEAFVYSPLRDRRLVHSEVIRYSEVVPFVRAMIHHYPNCDIRFRVHRL